MRPLLVSLWVFSMLALTSCASVNRPVSQFASDDTQKGQQSERSIVVASGIPRMWVEDITGAPGDGNQRLMSEIVRQMAAAGLRFARVPAEADYFVSADVDVYVIDARTEVAEIIWRVDDPNSTEIGQIRQQNPIPRGMLHDEWGEAADLAAQGGLEGVLTVLDSLGHPRP